MSCSNRSAALLQLKKSGKALEDAEQCIKRRPDWDKGFYRKGLALELSDRYPEVTLLIPASRNSLKGHACMPDLPLSTNNYRCYIAQALEAVEKALACNPSNVEMQRKARDLRKKTTGGGSAGLAKADKENESSQQAAKGAEGASQAQQRQPLKVCTLHQSALILCYLPFGARVLSYHAQQLCKDAGMIARTFVAQLAC